MIIIIILSENHKDQVTPHKHQVTSESVYRT